jgi:hypothetical protein
VHLCSPHAYTLPSVGVNGAVVGTTVVLVIALLMVAALILIIVMFMLKINSTCVYVYTRIPIMGSTPKVSMLAV